MAAKGKSWLGEWWRPLAALLLWVLGMVPLIAAPLLLPSLVETRVGGLTAFPVDCIPAVPLFSSDLTRACGPPLYDSASGCSVAANRGVQVNKLAGDSIRDVIAAREAPALIEQSMTTVGGVRRIDVLRLSEPTLAIESKVGRTSLTPAVRQELARDWWLLRQGKVGGVRWEFSPSQVTGKVGPTGALQEKIDRLGFETVIH